MRELGPTQIFVETKFYGLTQYTLATNYLLTKSEQSYVVFFAAASSIVFVNKYLINLYFSPK